MYLFGRIKGSRPDLAVHIFLFENDDQVETTKVRKGDQVVPLCGNAAASMDYQDARSKMEFTEKLPAAVKICGHCLERLRNDAAKVRKMIQASTERNNRIRRRSMPGGWR